jgi:hypothetical protein
MVDSDDVFIPLWSVMELQGVTCGCWVRWHKSRRKRVSLIFSDGRRKAIRIPALVGPWLKWPQNGPSHTHGEKTEQIDTYLSVPKIRLLCVCETVAKEMVLRLLTASFMVTFPLARGPDLVFVRDRAAPRPCLKVLRPQTLPNRMAAV